LAALYSFVIPFTPGYSSQFISLRLRRPYLATLKLSFDGRVIRGCAAAADMLAVDVGELVGRRVHELAHRPDQAGVTLAMASADRAGHVARFRFRSATAPSRAIDAVAEPDASGVTVSLVAGDPSAVESGDEFELFMDHVRHGVVVLDHLGRVIQLNRRLTELLGYDVEEFARMRAEDYTHPDDIEEDVRRFLEAASGLSDGYTIEKRYYRKDGQLFWARFTLSLRRDASGLLQRGYGLVEDINEEVRLREAGARNDRLATAGLAVAEVAHEFRTLLGTFGAAVELLSDDSRASNRAEVAAMAANTLHRADALVQGLLLLGRAPVAPKQIVSVANAVNGALELLRPRLSGRTLSVDVPEVLPGVLGSSMLVEQAVLNVLNNAIDATREGGTIQVVARVMEDGLGLRYLELSIADNGIGMAAHVAAQATTPFFSTKGHAGTGLGMAIVNRAVSEMRGELLVDSAPGEGTRIRIRYPVPK
jgi:PAS domain S-box-containing protein